MILDHYIAVINNLGISIYKENESFERLITYDTWEWKTYSIPNKLEFKRDYHNYHTYNKQNNSTYLVDYSFRYLQNMVDYLDPKEQLMYQIFGIFNDQKIPN